jgi:hypothetical protein
MALALRLRSGDGTSRKRPAPERSNRGTGPSQHGTALLRPKHPSTCPASWTRRRRRRRRRHTPHLSLARLLTTRPRRRPRTAPTTTPPTPVDDARCSAVEPSLAKEPRRGCGCCASSVRLVVSSWPTSHERARRTATLRALWRSGGRYAKLRGGVGVIDTVQTLAIADFCLK